MNTATLFVLPLTLLLLSCQQEKNAAQIPMQQPIADRTIADTTALFVPLPATSQEYLKAKKAYKEIIDTVSIPKSDGKITLPLKGNRPPVVISDSLPPDDETETKTYRYTGQVDNPAFYLVEGSFWEWKEYYLINKYTGKKDTLWATPVFSPDRNMMVNFSPSYGLEGNPNGLQVWQVLNNNGNATIRKLKTIDQEEWIPLDVLWLDNRTLIARAVSVDVFMKMGGKPKENDVYYFKMKVQ